MRSRLKLGVGDCKVDPLSRLMRALASGEGTEVQPWP